MYVQGILDGTSLQTVLIVEVVVDIVFIDLLGVISIAFRRLFIPRNFLFAFLIDWFALFIYVIFMITQVISEEKHEIIIKNDVLRNVLLISWETVTAGFQTPDSRSVRCLTHPSATARSL